MTTIVFSSRENALKWCVRHDVSTTYLNNLHDGWVLKYPGIHDSYNGELS